MFTIIRRTINGADIFGVIEEFPCINFSDINKILESLISCGHLIFINSRLRLTDSGNEYMKFINKQLGNKGIYKYILPFPNARIKSWDIDIPYIPHKKTKIGARKREL